MPAIKIFLDKKTFNDFIVSCKFAGITGETVLKTFVKDFIKRDEDKTVEKFIW